MKKKKITKLPLIINYHERMGNGNIIKKNNNKKKQSNIQGYGSER